MRKWLKDRAAALGLDVSRKRQAEAETNAHDSGSDWDADKPVDMQRLLVRLLRSVCCYAAENRRRLVEGQLHHGQSGLASGCRSR